MLFFEWDENKRKLNIQKHAIDFIDILEIFADPNRIELEVDSQGEVRIQTIGMLNEIILFLVYTRRGNKIRMISARRASKNERKAYNEA